ncbi:ABC transporter substrate-binding protein [Paenibacillus fonticola]|uniref:ABC transporter substrate-binding protein n=1 Tax=Paenibacillus fonticola TaxID=379896 RepID=UPI00047566C9|nr:iron-siderophore ABC transporter substrate-binding protein [Paenibacillus fonticola]
MFKARKEMLLLIFILSIILVISGCGAKGATTETSPSSSSTSTTSSSSSSSSASTSASAESAAADTANEVRSIEHAMGTTEIKGTPKRIVTLYQGATDVAVALGVKPVGMVESWVEQPVYNYLKQDLDGVPIVGLETQPNLEEISKLKPDLIIASKTRQEAVYDQLSQIAPTVTIEALYSFKDTVDMMGKAMNEEEKAQQLLKDWDRRVQDFKEKISQKTDIDWPKEVAVLNFRADHSRIYVNGFAPAILSELGFVFSEYQQQERDKGEVVIRLMNKEGIPSMNAGIFYIFKFDDADEEEVQKSYEEWTSHPLWKNLDAVKNDQVFMVNEVYWNLGGGIIAANHMLDEIYDYYGLAK